MFLEGERILTSSEGGAFPRGLVVGEAREVSGDWRVKFSMVERDGGYIQMIPPPEIAKPIPVEDLPPLETETDADPGAEPASEQPSAASPAQGARQ